MKNFSRIITGVALGVFILGLPSAQAVLGVRLARKVIMAERAAKAQKKISSAAKQTNHSTQTPSVKKAN